MGLETKPELRPELGPTLGPSCDYEGHGTFCQTLGGDKKTLINTYVLPSNTLHKRRAYSVETVSFVTFVGTQESVVHLTSPILHKTTNETSPTNESSLEVSLLFHF